MSSGLPMEPIHRRRLMRGWIQAGLAAVAPRRLTREALIAQRVDDASIIAMGKAASAMCWGVYDALGRISGICVAGTEAPLPPGVEIVVGDHPVPGEKSFEAGRRVLEMAVGIRGRCIALISGGGSSLCEHPRHGIEPSYVTEVSRVMLESGAPIDEMNLVRQHLSAIKGGGLAAAVPVPIETYVVSDVGRRNACWVASGPTIPSPADPDRAGELMRRYGIDMDDRVSASMHSTPDESSPRGSVTVLADGRTAGEAMVHSASQSGVDCVLADRWIESDVGTELASLFDGAPPGVTIAVGEPTLSVKGSGRGGRSTHAALLAATMLGGSDDIFMAFATDGIDGRSGAAGAIVDGTTTDRGGDPQPALQRFDSARYLANTGDLVTTGPTGTNVADIWILWRT